MERAVYVEKSPLAFENPVPALGLSRLFDIKHFAIFIGDFCYEVIRSEDGETYTLERKTFDQRKSRRFAKSKICGMTTQSDEEIEKFSEEWKAENKTYTYALTNCLKYAYELAHWACGGSCNLEMPVTQKAEWHVKSGNHVINQEGTGSIKINRLW